MSANGHWAFEVTDTFGGEANYCWANRWTAPATLTKRGVVRALKADMGWTGKKAEVCAFGDSITVAPKGRHAPCVVGFATWTEGPEPSEENT